MAELSVTATSVRDCAVCGKTFAPTRADAQYCSGACRQTAYRKRVTDNQVSAVPAATVTDNGDVRDAQQIEATPVSAPEPVPSAETARTPTIRNRSVCGARRLPALRGLRRRPLSMFSAQMPSICLDEGAAPLSEASQSRKNTISLEVIWKSSTSRVVVRATSFSYTPGGHKCLRVKRCRREGVPIYDPPRSRLPGCCHYQLSGLRALRRARANDPEDAALPTQDRIHPSPASVRR